MAKRDPSSHLTIQLLVVSPPLLLCFHSFLFWYILLEAMDRTGASSSFLISTSFFAIDLISLCCGCCVGRVTVSACDLLAQTPIIINLGRYH